MKQRKYQFNKLVTITVVCTLVFIGLLINEGKRELESALSSSALDDLKQVANQTTLLLENSINQDLNDLSLLAQAISHEEIPSEFVGVLKNNEITQSTLLNLYYVDLQGQGESSTGQHSDFSQNQVFINALKQDYVVGTPYIDSLTNQLHVDLAVPIQDEDELMGVLYAKTSISQFEESLFINNRGVGDVYIINTELDVFYSSNPGHHDLTSISFIEQEVMGSENVDIALATIEEFQSGGFTYEDESKALVYYPVRGSNWLVAFDVEVGASNLLLEIAVQKFEILIGGVYWLVLALVIYVSYVHFREHKRHAKIAYFDPLTNLPNELKLKLDMKQILKQNKNKQYSIIIFDIENFKAINEMFGHAVGDRVLKGIKSFFDKQREQSLIIARINGDKFAVFALSSYLSDLEKITQEALLFFEKVVPELINYTVPIIIGRYHIIDVNDDVDDIMSKVTLAHSHAKTLSNEMICDYDEEFTKMLLAEAEIVNKMRNALENDEFKVFLQPKFSTSEEELVGAEALCRWVEADGNIIYPSDFVPLFEKNGFIVELDKHILEGVCKSLQNWQNKGYGKLSVSVNCSRLNVENPFFVEGVVSIADKYEVPHDCIEIELTESTTIENEKAIKKLFDDLHHNGFKVSIDDFGAGYSSLGMLKDLKVDVLKLDRSFFIQGENKRREEMLVDSIIKMSHSLSMSVVAEGVESREQAELLKSMNCDAIQGFIFAKPMRVDEFERTYQKALKQKALSDASKVQLIKNINDARFASSFVPSGIIITKLDDEFTLVEANDSYFDIIGYTKKEVRDLFQNSGLKLIHPENRAQAKSYFTKEFHTNPQQNIMFVCRCVTKDRGYISVQLTGRIAQDEKGTQRLYISVTDVSHYLQLVNKVNKKEYLE